MKCPGEECLGTANLVYGEPDKFGVRKLTAIECATKCMKTFDPKSLVDVNELRDEKGQEVPAW